MEAIKLTVDSRNTISLTKLLPEGKISSVRAYREDEKIILEPMVEVPAREAWLYENREALRKIRAGLSQKGTLKRGSFAKYPKRTPMLELISTVRKDSYLRDIENSHSGVDAMLFLRKKRDE